MTIWFLTISTIIPDQPPTRAHIVSIKLNNVCFDLVLFPTKHTQLVWIEFARANWTPCPAFGSCASLDASERCNYQAFRHQYKIHCIHIYHNTHHQERWVKKIISLFNGFSINISPQNKSYDDIYIRLLAIISLFAHDQGVSTQRSTSLNILPNLESHYQVFSKTL